MSSAQLAYTAYRSEIQTCTGKQLPPWEELSSDEAMAWFEAAEAVLSQAAGWTRQALSGHPREPRSQTVKCPRCGKSFPDDTALSAHMSSAHTMRA